MGLQKHYLRYGRSARNRLLNFAGFGCSKRNINSKNPPSNVGIEKNVPTPASLSMLISEGTSINITGSGPKKWENLKDTYRRELRKETLLSGSAASQSSKWADFNDMSFIKSVMEPRPMSGNFTLESTEEVQFREDAEPLTPEPTPNKFKRKRNEENEFLELERKKLQLLERENVEEDDDYRFLMSFKKYMKKMNDEKKLQFRIKMQDVMFVNQHAHLRTSSVLSFVPSVSNSPTYRMQESNVYTFLPSSRISPVQELNAYTVQACQEYDVDINQI